MGFSRVKLGTTRALKHIIIKDYNPLKNLRLHTERQEKKEKGRKEGRNGGREGGKGREESLSSL